ncbi:transcriptional regulator of RNA polII, SAGA, subunit-domain-containing protein [Myxozyma melibiosi]|uniref:Transcriptional regulator of RNA polII, SAGA, subunit-domain-containing protein n=1 Tax=Myxozyma melibiosi TaxID=54550 RepID=A0ABR1F583_9ASCO
MASSVNGSSSARASPQPGSKKNNGIQHYASISGTSGTPAASASGGTTNTTPSKPQRPARRIEVEALMNDFRRVLGDKWARYREVITNFLIGKLTRTELEEELGEILEKSMVRMHNQFLLANLANSLRDPPPSTNGLPVWSTRRKDGPLRSRMSGDPIMARLKSEIMGFTPRERRRIKAITRDAGKKGPIPSTIILTRRAKMPAVPVINDKDKSKTNISQDIIQSYHLPLASESYELPDADALRTRLLGIAYEHGLLDGISDEVPDIILAGLEYHLRDFLQQIFNRVRPTMHKKVSDLPFVSLTPAAQDSQAGKDAAANKSDRKPTENNSKERKRKFQHLDDDNIITAEDMALALELVPHSIVEPSGPLYRLYDVMLRDEIDDARPDQSSAD